MYTHTLSASQCERFCKSLGISKNAPSVDALTEIVRAHISKIPFENISKLYYKSRFGIRDLVPLDMYLDGIEEHHFGGTCYATNYYLYLLLDYLGYDVTLCGADMSNPDVHIVNIVRFDGKEYIVDVGYAAPFLVPLPRDLQEDYQLTRNNDRYVLRPQDGKKRSRLDMFREGELRHGYTVNPLPRKIEEFTNIITGSFNENATFMNALLLVRFTENESCIIHNMTCRESSRNYSHTSIVASREELALLINEKFSISLPVLRVVLENVNLARDAWS